MGEGVEGEEGEVAEEEGAEETDLEGEVGMDIEIGPEMEIDLVVSLEVVMVVVDLYLVNLERVVLAGDMKEEWVGAMTGDQDSVGEVGLHHINWKNCNLAKIFVLK